MGFTVPNGPDAAVTDQAEPDALDYEVLGFRSSGVVSGCAVTARPTPGMSVAVASGKVLVNGEPTDLEANNVTIQSSDATPRFDLIVVDNTGIASAIRGTPSASNPVFPDCDLTTYVLLAAVYVGSGTSTINSTAIVDKRVMLSTEFKRSYENDTDTLMYSAAPSGVFSVEAGGKVSWVDATLSRIGVRLMQLTSGLVVQTSEALASLLTLRARTTAPENQKALDVQDAGGTTVASISGTGVITGANFLQGSGSPQTVVSAQKGTLYVDVTTPRNLTLWVCEGGASWSPMRSYDPGQDELPVGAISPYLGGGAPDGWLMLDGSPISTTDVETQELAALIGTTYGSDPGIVYLPDYRGLIPIGAGGAVALSIGDVSGTATTTLGVENLPAHSHNVTDPKHEHPSAGRPVYAPPTGPHRPSTDPTDITPYALAVETTATDRKSATGVTVGPTGGGQEFSNLPPVVAVNWMVKSHATYKRISAFSAETTVPVNDGGDVAYMTISEFQASLDALPVGGAADEVLVKASGDDYDYAWAPVPGAVNGVPAGGANGQVLYKTSNDDYVVGWVDAPPSPNGIPGGGTTGQYLVKSTPTDFEASWTTLPAAPVTSVNSQTGAAVLDADDIDDTATTNKFATQAQLNIISTLSSNYQPLDSDLSAIAALTTTAYGRSLLTLANQAALLSAAGAEPAGTAAAAVEALKGTVYGSVNHGAVAGTARPSGFAGIIWYGSVHPTAATGLDIVIRTDLT